ncbi:MAG: ATP-binding cassette domain-containing protein [Chloroflexi bacterium]|nr:ATP-binding cassette domain-containing protein [Chloroflexota bacterium]
MAEDNILIDVQNLTKHFPIRRGIIFERITGSVQAVDKISFTIRRGETLGMVGESGCGKTTLARVILGLMPATSGHVYFDGEDVCSLKGEKLRLLRKDMQLVFQDPYASLNPRMTVEAIVRTPMKAFNLYSNAEQKEKVGEILNTVGLTDFHAKRYPHQFSGGQRQRIGVARALAASPKFIIGDEPVSALDVSIRGQVLNLLKDLQDEFHLTYLFISHDLSVVQHVSDRVAVIYLGKLMELATGDDLYREPLHPYTQALLAAVPPPSPRARRTERVVIHGETPSPANPPSGCRFRTRCPKAIVECAEIEPPLKEERPGHVVACIRV